MLKVLWILGILEIIYGIPCAYTLDDQGIPTETDKEPWLVDDLKAC